jgi:hypothetical protein
MSQVIDGKVQELEVQALKIVSCYQEQGAQTKRGHP